MRRTSKAVLVKGSTSQILYNAPHRFDLLARCRWFAGSQIRNVSAIGGNIVTGSPISDLNPLWMASRTLFTAVGAGSGERSVPAKDFFLGYR